MEFSKDDDKIKLHKKKSTMKTTEMSCFSVGLQVTVMLLGRKNRVHKNDLDSKNGRIKPLQTATNLNLNFLPFFPYFLLLLLTLLKLGGAVKRQHTIIKFAGCCNKNHNHIQQSFVVSRSFCCLHIQNK